MMLIVFIVFVASVIGACVAAGADGEWNLFAGYALGATVGAVFVCRLFATSPMVAWNVAAQHCQTLKHTSGWWDEDAKRIRCVDTTEAKP